MQYSDLFPKPITEMSDEEIIAKAMELREKNAIPRFSPTAKAMKAPKATAEKKLSKAELAMQQALALATQRAADKESSPCESISLPS